jgi:predicted branched-subunit amino acid permease
MDDVFLHAMVSERLAEAERRGAWAARRAAAGTGRRARAAAGPARHAFWRGATAALPLGVANVPFALAYAVGAQAAGMDAVEAIGLSLLLYSGTAQFAAVGLVAAGAGVVVLAATALVASLRHLLLGAAVAPHLGHLGIGRRAAVAAVLTDEAFAVSVGPLRAGGGAAYLAGAGAALFATWQVSVALAVLFGRTLPLPAWLALDRVPALAMLALLVLVGRGRGDLGVAALAGGTAVAATLAGLGGASVLIGIASGALAGALGPAAGQGERR